MTDKVVFESLEKCFQSRLITKCFINPGHKEPKLFLNNIKKKFYKIIKRDL